MATERPGYDGIRRPALIFVGDEDQRALPHERSNRSADTGS